MGSLVGHGIQAYRTAREARRFGFAEKIIANELPGVLAWALGGSQLLAESGGRFIETAAHKAMMEKWRGRTDSVRSWLLDREAVELLRDHDD